MSPVIPWLSRRPCVRTPGERESLDSGREVDPGAPVPLALALLLDEPPSPRPNFLLCLLAAVLGGRKGTGH